MNGLTVAALGMAVSAFGPARADAYFDALTIAAIQGDVARVEAMLDGGADPNARAWLGLTPLAAAMRSCRMNADVLVALLASGADIEARSGVGATPLMIAWQNGRTDLAEVLLDAGANGEARNMYGDSAVEYREFFAGTLPEDDFSTLRYVAFDEFPPVGCSPAN